MDGRANKKVKVYDTLRRRIIEGELPPGLPIKEADFARELYVSKTPIREALRQLERDGFVENVPGRGSTIAHIGAQDIREVFEIREIIESGAAKRAAKLHDREEIRRKRDETRRMLEDNQATETRVHEWGSWEDVHVCIVKALGNRTLEDMYAGLLDRILRIRNYYGRRVSQRRLREIISEHATILDAIVDGNPDRAEEAMRAHLRNAGAFLVGLTEPEGD
jgi:DNA-binding GntR family transcriptional regulator